MGIFDLFRSKKHRSDIDEEDIDDHQTQGINWQNRLADFGNLEDAAKRSLAQEILQEIGKQLTDSRVRGKGESEIELRGRWASQPVRLILDCDMGWIYLGIKCANRIGTFDLEWDPKKGPIPLEEDEDWADENAGVRIFVSKGVFLEDAWSKVEQDLAVLSVLPPETADSLYQGIQRHHIYRFHATEKSIEVVGGRDFNNMSDPPKTILSIIALMSDIATALAAGSRNLQNGKSIFSEATLGARRPERFQCSYCQTQFPLTSTAKCPNCGAPATDAR